MLIKKIKLVQIKSSIGRTIKQKSTLIGLGLRGIGSVSTVKDTPSIRGMINKISYMIKVY